MLYGIRSFQRTKHFYSLKIGQRSIQKLSICQLYMLVRCTRISARKKLTYVCKAGIYKHVRLHTRRIYLYELHPSYELKYLTMYVDVKVLQVSLHKLISIKAKQT